MKYLPLPILAYSLRYTRSPETNIANDVQACLAQYLYLLIKYKSLSDESDKNTYMNEKKKRYTEKNLN